MHIVFSLCLCLCLCVTLSLSLLPPPPFYRDSSGITPGEGPDKIVPGIRPAARQVSYTCTIPLTQNLLSINSFNLTLTLFPNDLRLGIVRFLLEITPLGGGSFGREQWLCAVHSAPAPAFAGIHTGAPSYKTSA